MLREQVITPRSRAGGSKGRSGAGVAQRPATRRGGRGGTSGGASAWRSALRFAPLALKLSLGVALGVALYLGYRAASAASFFRLAAVEVEGASRTSVEEVRSVVRRHASAAGVWNADLAAIGEELKRQPWVRACVVSRVLPSGVRVRVAEREPRVVVRTASGRFAWVDDEGVMLGTAAPSDSMPPFFVRGYDEAPTDAARAANRVRVARAEEMRREWEAAGLVSRVSEVNLDDLDAVRAQLTGNDAQIEVRLGDKDFGARLSEALKTLDRVRQQHPEIVVTRLDATHAAKGGRVVVGYDKSGGASGETTATDAGAAQGVTTTTTERREPRATPKREQNATRRSAADAGRDARRGEAAREVRRRNRAG